MYVNAKMRPLKTAPGIRRGRECGRIVNGEISSLIYLIHCKNLCKC
jgi:hypothetical protein